MRTLFLTVAMLVCCTSVCWQSEDVDQGKKEQKRVEKKNIEDIKYVKKVEVPKTPKYNKRVFVRAVNWTIENLDKIDGWSLSGWSKMGLTSNFDPWYLKIGAITGRLGAERELDYVENCNWKHFADWERREYIRDHGMIFGVHWVLLFGGEGEKKDVRTEVERLIDAAFFYGSLPHNRGRRAAVFTYREILRRFPETEEAKVSKEKISIITQRFPGLYK